MASWNTDAAGRLLLRYWAMKANIVLPGFYTMKKSEPIERCSLAEYHTKKADVDGAHRFRLLNSSGYNLLIVITAGEQGSGVQ